MTIDALADFYPWIKAFHVISLIAWMAGLFYLPRLFVYHTMTAPGTAESERMKVMERRLYHQITMPAMVLTWVFGVLLVLTPGIIDWASMGWWHVKLLGVLGMTLYHFLLDIWRNGFLQDRNVHTERFYRIINEVPTVLMIVIVIMVIVRPF